MTATHHESDVDRAKLAPLQAFSRGQRAFSLIEICIALGIVAFAFVALLGLLPVGLSNYSQAMNTQTSTEIYQRIAAEIQETEFDTLLKPSTWADSGGSASGVPAPMFFQMKLRYFDTEGQEVKVVDPTNPTDDEKKSIIYTVRVRGSFPGKANPTDQSSNYFTSLPDISGKRFNPRDDIFFAIQVVQSGGRDIKPIVDKDAFFILPAAAAKAGFPLRTYSILVARNGYDLTTTP